MRKILTRLSADAILVALVLFVSAGTVAWMRAWALIVVLLLVRFVSAAIAYRVNPALLRDRAGSPLHADQPLTDKILVVAILGIGFLGIPAMAGLDRFHWHVFAAPPISVAAAGMMLFIAGWGIKGWALRSNPFATVALRLQTQVNHVVAASGPYSIVRHPFYAADPLIFFGLSLWLGSYIAALCSFVPIALMVLRLTLEERMLREVLPDYREYATRVRYRLVPGLW